MTFDLTFAFHTSTQTLEWPSPVLIACYAQGPRPFYFPVLSSLPACLWELCVRLARWWFPPSPEHCGPHRGLDSFSGKPRGSGPPAGSALPIEGVILSLQDLIGYFEPPSEELQHEEKQTKLRSLRNRQSLFQEEVKLLHEGRGLEVCRDSAHHWGLRKF